MTGEKFCRVCDREIAKSHWKRHIESKGHQEKLSENDRVHCQVCKRDYKKSNWEKHLNSKAHKSKEEKLNPARVTCATCRKTVNASNWQKHLESKTHQARVIAKEKVKEIKHCDACNEDVKKVYWERHIHSAKHKNNDVSFLLLNDAFDKEESIEGVKDFIRGNPEVFWRSGNGELKQVFRNYEFTAGSIEEVRGNITRIYNGMKNASKMNLIITGVGIDQTDGKGEFQVMHPSNLKKLFVNKEDGLPNEPMTISNQNDLDRLLAYITEDNLRQVLFRHSSGSSSFQPIGIISFDLQASMLNAPLGCLGDDEIPEDLRGRNSGSVRTMAHNKDNLCFFRCIESFNRPTADVRYLTKGAVKLFQAFYWGKPDANYPGITLAEISQYSDHIETNIEVFLYGENKFDLTPLLASKERYSETVSLLQYKEHMMLIMNKSALMGKYQCDKCKRMFANTSSLKTHQKSSTNCYTNGFVQKDEFVQRTQVWSNKWSAIDKVLLKYNMDSEFARRNILTWDFETSTDRETVPARRVVKKKGKVIEPQLKFNGRVTPMSYSIAYRIDEGKIQKVTRLIDDCENCPKKFR